jgi:soluble lytic murein transglycosylase
MQVMPKTGRQLARQLKLRYSRSRLFQPDFNLRLGTTHLKRLVSELGSLEAALAAYNAGESRVAQWTAGRTYSEPAEFVETIPFAETREYVQIVMRNRLIYRHLYGNSQAASVSGSPMSPAR